MRQVCTSRL